MPTLQIRIDEQSHSKIKERGGSPWAREILLEALNCGEPERELEPAPLADLPELKQEILEPGNGFFAEQLPVVHEGLCPRWMHHRSGVFCKVCGELQ